jgi:hypothetical protein
MSGASWWDNLKLGGAGLVDLAAGTHYAAEVYAEQTGAGVSSGSVVLDAIGDPAKRKEAALGAGLVATEHGAISDAARKTKEQVQDSSFVTQHWEAFLGTGLVLGGVLVVWKLLK